MTTERRANPRNAGKTVKIYSWLKEGLQDLDATYAELAKKKIIPENAKLQIGQSITDFLVGKYLEWASELLQFWDQAEPYTQERIRKCRRFSNLLHFLNKREEGFFEQLAQMNEQLEQKEVII